MSIKPLEVSGASAEDVGETLIANVACVSIKPLDDSTDDASLGGFASGVSIKPLSYFDTVAAVVGDDSIICGGVVSYEPSRADIVLPSTGDLSTLDVASAPPPTTCRLQYFIS